MTTNIITTRRLAGITAAVAIAIAALALAPGAARASTTATNPGVRIGPATDISAREAIVHGAVNPDGHLTQYQFQFYSSANRHFIYATATADAGPGTQFVSVSGALTKLAPGTTYHYRLVAQNAAGTTPTPWRTFTTL
jgi:phosphodiesterase/alkaline phosphatase D-like protein